MTRFGCGRWDDGTTRRDARWRMYLLCLAADMRDAGVIDEAQYRRIVGRVDDMDARDVVRVVEEICGKEGVAC